MSVVGSRSEESVRSPKAGVRGDYEPSVLGVGTSARTVYVPNS